MSRMSSVLPLALLLFAVESGPMAQAETLSVSLNTSALSGSAAALAFDLVDGDASLGNNSASVSGFATDGNLGGAVSAGGVSGSAPDATLADTAAFNERLQFLALGASIQFTVTLTGNWGGGGDPDQFALYLLDGAGLASLVATTQAVGANALFTYDFTGQAPGNLRVYSASDAVSGLGWTVALAPSAIPEPATAGLLGLGGLPLASASRKRRQALAPRA
jgi:hypothetical protein